MRLPSLEKIEHYTYFSVIIGAPLLLMALSLGVVWVVLEGDRNLLYDPKVINSFFVLAAYAFYLFQHHSMRISGNKLAVWNLAAFLYCRSKFCCFESVSGFHGWIWS